LPNNLEARSSQLAASAPSPFTIEKQPAAYTLQPDAILKTLTTVFQNHFAFFGVKE